MNKKFYRDLLMLAAIGVQNLHLIKGGIAFNVDAKYYKGIVEVREEDTPQFFSIKIKWFKTTETVRNVNLKNLVSTIYKKTGGRSSRAIYRIGAWL